MSTSNCPACGSSSFYSGVFGPNCIKPGCVHFQNGTCTRTATPIAMTVKAVEAPARAWKVGEVVYVNQMAGWGHPQGKTWMCATILALPNDEDPQDPLYCVEIQGTYLPDDSNVGSTVSAGRTWFSREADMRRDHP